MPLHISALDIVLRILSALVGSFIIGFNRGEHGHEAGVRTNVLICLAACLAMLQANVLLDLSGKTSESFVVMDLMRLPLGILSGIGFIGGGAILRNGNRVTGVTTAATLWFLTVIGLCFGGGQLELGWGGILLTVFILTAFRKVEEKMPKAAVATLIVHIEPFGPSEEILRKEITQAQLKIRNTKITYLNTDKTIHVEWSLDIVSETKSETVHPIVQTFSKINGLSLVQWSP